MFVKKIGGTAGRCPQVLKIVGLFLLKIGKELGVRCETTNESIFNVLRSPGTYGPNLLSAVSSGSDVQEKI